MSTPVLSHLDFDKKAQILNILLHSVASDPAPWKGGLIYNTGEDVVKWSDGISWHKINDIGNSITDIIQGAGITVSGSGSSRTITFRPDDQTLENNNNDKATVKALGIDTAHIADNAIVNIKIADNTISFSKHEKIPSMTLMGYTSGGGTGDVEGVTVIENITEALALHQNIASAKAIKDYVDGLVGGLGSLVDGYSASSNNVFPSDAKKGDYWYITSPGSIQGISFIEGDVIIARQNNAANNNADHWIPLKTKRGLATTENLGIVQLATNEETLAMSDSSKAVTPSNIGALKATNVEAQGSDDNKFITPQGLHNRTATENRRGIAEIATQAEVNAGEDDQRIVTAAKLHVFVNAQLEAYGKYISDPFGGATQIDITHGMNDEFVQVEVIKASNKKTIICDITRHSENVVRLGFATAPTANSLIAIIQK